jgi:hypothetical protein
MSQLLALQNRLKIQARADRLTNPQRRIYDAIVAAWRYPGRLNLYGAPGAGKTFLGWCLAYEQDVQFIAGPELLAGMDLPTLSQPLIVDNVAVDAYALRHLLATLDLAQIRTALLISRSPNPDLLPGLELPASTATDIAIVRRNLSDVEHYPVTTTESANLWNIIHSTLSGGTTAAHEH